MPGSKETVQSCAVFKEPLMVYWARQGEEVLADNMDRLHEEVTCTDLSKAVTAANRILDCYLALHDPDYEQQAKRRDSTAYFSAAYNYAETHPIMSSMPVSQHDLYLTLTDK